MQVKRSQIIWTSVVALFTGSMVCGGSGLVSAYEAGAVTDGAVVRGTVTLQGLVPEPKSFELRRYPDRVFCGALSNGDGYRMFKEVLAGEQGGLKDVVVMVEGIQQGKPFTTTEAQIEANVCQFLPYVTIVGDKQQLTVINRDPVSHDIQGYTYDQAGVDIVLHRSSLKATGTTETVHLVKGRKVFTMQCGMHPYMQNWGYAVDHPYYAITGVDGSFSIGEVPPGTYRIKAWHPALGELEREIVVEANGTVQFDLTFEAK